MILKQRDEKLTTNKYEKAGEKAEAQMMHYLQRAFGDDENTIVLNDLRIKDANGEVAQMDHLIIHEFGFIIVESKSVTTEITINEEGEWIRHFNGRKGMPSPINQAQRQIKILKKVLESNKEKLFRKNLVTKMLKTSFHNYPFDVLIAISDSGIINRPKQYNTSMVLKADQVCDRIEEIIDTYRKKSKSLLPIDIPASFYNTTMQVIAALLTSKHVPIEQNAINNRVEEEQVVYGEKHRKEEAEKRDLKTFCCKHCKSDKVQIVWGKYGYYFKCSDCDGNTPIKLTCKDNSCKVKLKKEKDHFYKICETCHRKELYFINQR